jgi:hypothetical protein
VDVRNEASLDMRVLVRSIGVLTLVFGLLAMPAAALACETYVVGELVQTGPHPWQPQAVIEVVVTRVDEAEPALIDRNPIGYQLSTRRVLRGENVPKTIEVVRANGCDTMRLAIGERLIVAVVKGADLSIPRGGAPGYGVDNYNSAWYRLFEPDRLRLVRGSAWLPGLQGAASIEDVLRVADGLPATDAGSGPSAGSSTPTVGLAIGGLLGVCFGLRVGSRRTHRGAGRPA